MTKLKKLNYYNYITKSDLNEHSYEDILKFYKSGKGEVYYQRQYDIDIKYVFKNYKLLLELYPEFCFYDVPNIYEDNI